MDDGVGDGLGDSGFEIAELGERGIELGDKGGDDRAGEALIDSAGRKLELDVIFRFQREFTSFRSGSTSIAESPASSSTRRACSDGDETTSSAPVAESIRFARRMTATPELSMNERPERSSTHRRGRNS